LLAFAVYELTAQPGLAAAVACTKFGWNDFLTARWLWRIDPNRRRARACGFLYIASGFWKIAVTGFALMMLFGVVAAIEDGGKPQPNQKAGEPPPMFIGAILAAFIGIVLSTLTTCAALWSAWRHRVKLWLSGGVHGARRQDIWPSLYRPAYARDNHAQAVVITALVIGYFVGCGIVLLAAASVLAPIIQGNAAAGMGVCMIAMIGGPILLLCFKDLLARRVIAQGPADCWSPSEAEAWLRRMHPEWGSGEPAAGAPFPADG
jgi:hypothetical protein